MHYACSRMVEQLLREGKTVRDIEYWCTDLCEDDITVMVMAEIGELTLTSSFDWPRGLPFDHCVVEGDFIRHLEGVEKCRHQSLA